MKQYHQYGCTALMKGAEKGHIEVVKMLLDRSANIEAVDYVSRNVSIACTALSIAIIIVLIMIIIIIAVIISITVIILIIFIY